MKALTVHEPWATAIIGGWKQVENRQRQPDFKLVGQRFAIHAGRASSMDEEHMTFVSLALGVQLGELQGLCRPGHIIGTVLLKGAVAREEDLPEAQRRWFSGRFGWLLAEPRALKTPVPCRGLLGFWDVPPEVEQLVADGGGWP